MKFSDFKIKAKESNSPLLTFLLRRFYYKKIVGINVLCDQNSTINNPQNITVDGLLKIGIDYIGFTSKFDKTLLNINGKLVIMGDYSIGKGCRFDIAENATIEIGKGGYTSAFTNYIIMHGLKIGKNCFISWGCQFLDDDFHVLEYPNNKQKILANKIEIGNNVWIGCHTFIYKGVKIPNDCVVASNSVVKTTFTEENALIGGNPAKILKRNINWRDK